MIEKVNGTGKLISVDTGQEWQVQFRFDIYTETVETPEEQRVGVRRSSKGLVSSTKGDPIPKGEYELHADAEILRVTNESSEWAIIFA